MYYPKDGKNKTSFAEVFNEISWLAVTSDKSNEAVEFASNTILPFNEVYESFSQL